MNKNRWVALLISLTLRQKYMLFFSVIIVIVTYMYIYQVAPQRASRALYITDIAHTENNIKQEQVVLKTIQSSFEQYDGYIRKNKKWLNEPQHIQQADWDTGAWLEWLSVQLSQYPTVGLDSLTTTHTSQQDAYHVRAHGSLRALMKLIATIEQTADWLVIREVTIRVTAFPEASISMTLEALKYEKN